MTPTANARLAGATFLVYIGAGVATMATLPAGVGILLALVNYFSALILAVTLYTITSGQDPTIAMLGLTCRVAEGVLGAALMPIKLALVPPSTTGAGAPDPQVAHALAAILLNARSWNVVVSATFFAVGSMAFCWLLLRGRMIPAALAWLGLFASVVLVVGLPLQLAGVLHGPVTMVMWLPMAAFEIPAGVWMLVNGVRGTAAPRPDRASSRLTTPD